MGAADDRDAFSGDVEELSALLDELIQGGFVGGNASALSRLADLTAYLGSSGIKASHKAADRHTPRDLLIVESKADMELAIERGNLDEALALAELIVKKLNL